MTFEKKPMRESQDVTKGEGTVAGEGQSKYRFGNYDLVRRIDVGGMGEVYLARQRTIFNREVAIKIIRSDLVHDAVARKRFLREAEVNAHLKHEHILPLYEFGEEAGRLFLVTPFIAGGTLSRRLQSGPLSLAEVHQLFTALVQAVAYIHRRGVVHRDLKPSNILLDQEENSGEVYVRLIDFGIASISGMAASPPLTRDGTSMATIAYMAPERLSGIAAPSNDIYSLGVILYQMLTGQLPAGENSVALPQPLAYVVNRCMAPVDEGRFATAEDVLHAFEYACEYLTTTPPQKNAPSTSPSIPVPVVADADVTHKRISTAHHAVKLRSEVETPQHSAHTDSVQASSSRPQRPDGFNSSDYESPTVNVDTSNPQPRRVMNFAPASAPVPVPVKPPRARRGRRSPLFAIISFLIIFILLAIAGLFFFEFQAVASVSASVNFRPQFQTVGKVFSIKGSVNATGINATTATIPVKTASESKTGSQTGQTTEQCVLPPFGCQRIVTSDVVNAIAVQLKQNLDSKITQDLKNRLASLGAVQVGSLDLSTTSATANPPIGSQSNTVTVTMTEQGQVAYFLKNDAQTLARQLLTQQAQRPGPNYLLLSSSIRVGQPVVEVVNASTGLVSIKIAAGGVAEYQFSPAQLRSIQNAVKNKKIKDAISLISRQPGVDANTVAIHLTVGDTMPADISHIKIIPITPANPPPAQLPRV